MCLVPPFVMSKAPVQASTPPVSFAAVFISQNKNVAAVFPGFWSSFLHLFQKPPAVFEILRDQALRALYGTWVRHTYLVICFQRFSHRNIYTPADASACVPIVIM